MAKKNFYAVAVGRKPGIYTTWNECKEQVDGYSGAKYKGFITEDDALRFLNGETGDVVTADCPIAYVDGSFDAASWRYSCGVVILNGNRETHLSDCGDDPELATMRNVAGEILGATMAMQYAKDNGMKEIMIVHDYEGIAKWCTGEWKCNKDGTKEYRDFFLDMSNSINIGFKKVKGHSGDFYNDLADCLAKKELGIQISKTFEEYIQTKRSE